VLFSARHRYKPTLQDCSILIGPSLQFDTTLIEAQFLKDLALAFDGFALVMHVIHYAAL